MTPKARLRAWQKAGIKIADYEIYVALFGNAKGKCEICEKKLSLENGNTDQPTAHLDHDHKTGKARGILCPNCNYTLGFLETRNRKNMKRTAEYILNRFEITP